MTRGPMTRAGTGMRFLSFRGIWPRLSVRLKGPSDLGRNHDKYLAYPDRDEASGAASA